MLTGLSSGSARLTGRRDGGAYGTSLFMGLFIAGRLTELFNHGTEALTGRATLWDS